MATSLSILAIVPPLVPLASKSHLLARVAWLGKVVRGAALFCISSFTGAIVGLQMQAQTSKSMQEVVELLSWVIATTAYVGIMVLALWLAVDVWGLGGRSGREAAGRAIAFVVGGHAGDWLMQGRITNWFVAVASPLWTAVTIWVFATQTLWPTLESGPLTFH
ncbi:hypothetical protein D9V28_07715 [Mycetocola zhadangensis]|uniref:Uncharacterized protein n=1 Tax=Mycetocola zhadangensis TaxID=1164595 RepID=A0A3L7J3U2_9MICO|nr:hypothetical protein D9V28_07715 [Mycetocola zhadangensis]